jgi:hypothetical protein
MGFEPTIPVFERAKIFYALYRPVTVIDLSLCNGALIKYIFHAAAERY